MTNKDKNEDENFPFLKTKILSFRGTFEDLFSLNTLQDEWLRQNPHAIPVVINQSMTSDNAGNFTVIINIWYEEIDPKVLAASHPLFKPLEKTGEREEHVRFPIFSSFPSR